MKKQFLSISDFCQTSSGTTPPRDKMSLYFGGTIPWVKSGEVAQDHIVETEEKVTEEAVKSCRLRVLPPGTILVAMYGATAGQVGMLEIPATTNQAVCGLQADPEIVDRRYLFQALRANTKAWLASRVGGAQPNLSQEIIKNTKIFVPPLPEQRRVAVLLDQADGIRRKRREAIVLAESFLRSAFLEMFGDTVGNPLGWEVRALGETLTLNPTAPKELRANPSETISFISMSSASELYRQPQYVLAEAETYLKGYTYFAKDDVLMAKITPCMENGKAAYLHDMPTAHGFGSTEFHVLRPNERVLGEYLYHLVHSAEFRAVAARNMTGTAGQRRVPTAFLERFLLPLPPVALQERFAKLVRGHAGVIRRMELALAEAEGLFGGLVAGVFAP